MTAYNDPRTWGPRRFARMPEPLESAALGILGSLNFGAGRPDPRFQRQLNEAYTALAERGSAAPWQDLHQHLQAELRRFQQEDRAAFRDIAQAEAVLRLRFLRPPPPHRAPPP